MGLEIITPLKVVNPIHLDDRYGPYASVAAAKAAIPVATRVKGLTVGVLSAGVVSEYWWKSGTADGDLIIKADGGVSSVTGMNTDNTDPLNPVVRVSVDGLTIVGDGTPGNPLVSVDPTGGTAGSYTPIITGASYTTLTPKICYYIRIGNVVTVSGSVGYVVPASFADRIMSIELPIASALIGPDDLSGTTSNIPTSLLNYVEGNVDGEAKLHTNTDTSGTVYFEFKYLVITP